MNFKEWLEENKYRESTQKRYIAQLRRAKNSLSDGVLKLPVSTLDALRCWVKYIENEKPKLNANDQQLLEIIKNDLEKNKSHGREKKRKLEARSFTVDDLAALSEQIIKDTTPEGYVLHVLLDTGLRIGDILRLPVETIKSGLRAGVLPVEVKRGDIVQVPIAGAKEVWWKLYRALKVSGQSTVAWWVCPNGTGNPEAGYGAYQCVNRRFKELGENVGVHGRVHLHRLRRSFAIDALKHSGDITVVQQALGHRSVTSTQKYLDEVRIDDVADVQKAIRENRKKRQD